MTSISRRQDLHCCYGVSSMHDHSAACTIPEPRALTLADAELGPSMPVPLVASTDPATNTIVVYLEFGTGNHEKPNGERSYGSTNAISPSGDTKTGNPRNA